MRWKMRAILLPKYYDQKVALRPELYIVFTTKVCRSVEAWQWMPPPKSRNTKVCKWKTFMISHIFFGIKASFSCPKHNSFLQFSYYCCISFIYVSLYSHDNSLGIQYFLSTCQYKRKWFNCITTLSIMIVDHLPNAWRKLTIVKISYKLHIILE